MSSEEEDLHEMKVDNEKLRRTLLTRNDMLELVNLEDNIRPDHNLLLDYKEIRRFLIQRNPILAAKVIFSELQQFPSRDQAKRMGFLLRGKLD